MARDRADVGLAQCRLDVGVAHVSLLGGAQAGTVFAEVVDVRTAHDGGRVALGSERGELSDRVVQVALAVVAAIGRVAEVAVVVELSGPYELEVPAFAPR